MVAEGPEWTCSVRLGVACLMLAVAALLPGTAAAAGDPYQVAIPVPDQSAAARRSAEREGLARILTRLTGARDVTRRPELADALRAPQRHFMQSGYARIRDPELARTHPDARWLLELQADRASVLALLAAARMPAWTGRRPEVLVIAVQEDERGERNLLEPTSDVARGLLRAGAEWGLPLAVPLLDLEDRLALDPTRLWARFDDATAPAARRYEPDATFILRIYQDALGRWLADWQGEVAGESFDAAVEVSAPEAAGRALVERLAARLTARYALRVGTATGEGEWVWLQVDELAGLEAYAGMMDYLTDLSAVGQIRVVYIQGDSLLLRFQSNDEVGRLLDMLRLEARLVPRSAPEYVGDVPVWRALWQAGR